jgi:hypothetical protein
MARKSKKRARQRVRPQAPIAAATAPRPVERPQQRVGGDSALVRAVEMSLAPSAPVKRGRGQSMILDGGNPAIPLDRVPYFWPDLRRLAMAVVIMVALLIGGSFLIPLVIR